MGEKILVVENDVQWQDILLTMLRRTPYELCMAKSCEEAEELLKQHEFVLVTINMNLADVSTMVNDQLGFDILELLQGHPNLPRIVLTSEINGPIFSTYMPFGVNEILYKPTLTRPQLIQAIQNAIGQRARPKKPYDHSDMCDLMNKHTTEGHVRLLQQKLKARLPGERVFSSYENLQGETKIEKLDHILNVLETYELVYVACQFLKEIKPDDILLKQGLEEIELFGSNLTGSKQGRGSFATPEPVTPDVKKTPAQDQSAEAGRRNKYSTQQRAEPDLANLEVNITVRGKLEAFTTVERMNFISMLSRALDIGPDEIRIRQTRAGSVLLVVEMSEKAAQLLMSMYSAQAPIIDTLRIEKVELKQSGIPDVASNPTEYRQLSSPSSSSSGSPISWERWHWQSTDGSVTIPESVTRDILLGLEDTLPDTEFCTLHRDSICYIAASPDENRRTLSCVQLWEKLWLQEPGLPYSPLMKLLAVVERSGKMYSEYRDHVAHTIWTYLLGLYLYKQNRPIREAIQAKSSEGDFLRAWKVATLFHDIGYTFDRGLDHEEEFLRPILDELQVLVDSPLRGYLQARGAVLLEKEENDIAHVLGRFIPKVISLDDVEFSPRPGPKKKLLDRVEDLAIPTQLAQEGRKTPLQSYYELGKKEKPKDRDRFRDHGILSALILLYQFDGLDYYLEKLERVNLPTEISRKTREELESIVRPPITQHFAEIVRHAAAAIALHNVNPEVWEPYKTKREPYHLSLDDYRISLEESPLAFLLALTDVLQCWDRPKRRYVDKPGELAARNQDVHITCEDDVIFWAVRADSTAGKQLISPSQQIKTISSYMAYKGKKDLSQLIKEKPSS